MEFNAFKELREERKLSSSSLDESRQWMILLTVALVCANSFEIFVPEQQQQPPSYAKVPLMNWMITKCEMMEQIL